MSAIIYNTDCITGMRQYLDADSVDLVVTSPPFGQLFMYSGKIEDVGNNQDGRDMRASRFGLHMRFFVEQLFRVLKPGCNACIHIQQLLKYKNEHGWAGRRDFRGAIIDIFEYGGFEYIGEVAIPKNPQIIAQRLKLHSLQFATGKRHSARKLAPAVNDYVIVFQKPGEAAPVLAISDAVENPSGWVTAGDWISYAHGVWFNENKTYHFNNTAYVEQGLDALFEENLKLEYMLFFVFLFRLLKASHQTLGSLLLTHTLALGQLPTLPLSRADWLRGSNLKNRIFTKLLRTPIGLSSKRLMRHRCLLWANENRLPLLRQP